MTGQTTEVENGAWRMTKSRSKLKWAQTLNTHIHTHTHTDCANPVPVNCSVLESLGRHQRAWAASCSELQIPSRLNVDAWPSRLDQPLIHSLGPGNYWVSTEPHAAASISHAQHARAHKGGVGHRNARHAGRPGCHENRQRCSQIHQCLSPWRLKAGQRGWKWSMFPSWRRHDSHWTHLLCLWNLK